MAPAENSTPTLQTLQIVTGHVVENKTHKGILNVIFDT